MSEWISVKERLPEIEKWVLWLDGKNTMNRTCIHHIDKIDKHGDAFEHYVHNYTHWMPLPPPPEGEE